MPRKRAPQRRVEVTSAALELFSRFTCVMEPDFVVPERVFIVYLLPTNVTIMISSATSFSLLGINLMVPAWMTNCTLLAVELFIAKFAAHGFPIDAEVEALSFCDIFMQYHALF